MKITVDTHVLVRATVRDDPEQAALAERSLREASVIAVAIPTLCEFVWVLRRAYALAPADIASTVRALLDTEQLSLNRPAAEAGLARLEAGRDFADGAIAYEGNWLGSETFVSFDRKAVALLTEQGRSAGWLHSGAT